MIRLLVLSALLLWPLHEVEARGNFPSRIPNGSVNSCSNCHFNPGGGGARTPFGEAFRSNNRQWSEGLANADADGDGFTNGEELQDAHDWIISQGRRKPATTLATPAWKEPLKSPTHGLPAQPVGIDAGLGR